MIGLTMLERRALNLFRRNDPQSPTDQYPAIQQQPKGSIQGLRLDRGMAAEAKMEVKLEIEPVLPALPPSSPNSESGLKRLVTATVVVAAMAGLALGGTSWYRYLTAHESTDDAYTTAHIHPVSSRIDDTVQSVLVDDNEHVKAGQVLVVLDPRDFQVRAQEAQAALSVAKHQAEAAKTSIALSASTASGKTTEATGSISNAEASIGKAQAEVVQAQAQVPAMQAQLNQRKAEEWRAGADYNRFSTLAAQGAISLQQRDSALRDYAVAQQATKAAEEAVRQAEAQVDQAKQTVSTARAQLVQSKGTFEQAQALDVQTKVNESQYQVAQSAISQAQAQLDNAQLQLSYTKITAPIDGRIGKKSVEEGQRAQPGQQLLSVVSDDVWVVANFKETQLERMRPGQTAEIQVDSFPHHTFTGKIDSVSPGSGSTFALLPSDNATGNFTKIVQRVPVKIIFDNQSIKGYENVIVPGMSVVVTVSVPH
jgi:membrane fusion protein (multidrug efflux system)